MKYTTRQSSSYYQSNFKKKKLRKSGHQPHHKNQHKYKNKKNYYRSSSSSSSSSSKQSSSEDSASRRHKTPHFHFRIGQKLGHKYRIKKLLGDGTFGRVVEGTYHDKSFAIKIIKPVDRYIDSAKTERHIIRYINERDSADEQGIVRYLESFYHHNHFCMVFKPLGKSLYDVIKLNRYQGFPIKMVQSFFKQMLRSIGFLHRIGYTHTDLKPQNILLQTTQLIKQQQQKQDQNSYYLPDCDKIRIIDFGGATKHDQYHTTIINTRQYRGPQVILQCCKWNEISDVWSIGCIISELYTGQLLFQTHSDVEHLYMMQKNSGYFPHWMISKTNSSFRKIFKDGKISEDEVDKKITSWENIVGMKTIKEIFQHHPELSDLLMKCLEIDPNNRINCMNALNHPFFKIEYS